MPGIGYASPRASLQLNALEADELASYKYAKKRDITNHFDDALIEAINEKLLAGRARAIKGHLKSRATLTLASSSVFDATYAEGSQSRRTVPNIVRSIANP